MRYKSSDIRQMFLDYFRDKNHKIIESGPLVPKNDPTILFTNSGMNQFKQIFLGIEKPLYKRVATSQRCLRAGGKHNDLEKIGHTKYHLTFFEMLGNFSFGDYFKYDAIALAWEFLTCSKWLNLSKDRLWVTVYKNDEETYKIWTEKIKIPKERVVRIGDINNINYKSDNFWKMGNVGPCGPCSEILYSCNENTIIDDLKNFDRNKKFFIEIWNLVFLQFNRQSNGNLETLSKLFIDTGMGLERITTILQKVESNFHIDVFKDIISEIINLNNIKNKDNKSLYIIADHIRSCVFLIGEGVIPSNDGSGYVLRRIIRRAILKGNSLGIKEPFLYKLVKSTILIMGSVSLYILPKTKMIEKILKSEEEKFLSTLVYGLELLNKKLKKLKDNILDGKFAFQLYDTYGFPLDLTIDICSEKNFYVDKKGFENEMSVQKKRSLLLSNFSKNYKNLFYLNKETKFLGYKNLSHSSKIISIIYKNKLTNYLSDKDRAIIILDETPFYGESGGQIGDRGEIKSNSGGIFKVLDTKKHGNIVLHIGNIMSGELKVGEKIIACVDSKFRKNICLNHSSTHLLHAALQNVLGKNSWQKGSLISDQYLRFDFFCDKSLKLKDLFKIEEVVNDQIRNNLIVKSDLISLDEAYKKGATFSLHEKYQSIVRILNIGNFSSELCIGTHVGQTGEIGIFYIVSKSYISSNICRVKAITGDKALNFIRKQGETIFDICKIINSNEENVVNKINSITENFNKLETEIKILRNKEIKEILNILCKNVIFIDGIKILIDKLEEIDQIFIKKIINALKNKLNSAIIVLFFISKNKINIISVVTKDLTYKIKANEIINNVINLVDGKGGGKSHIAYGESKNKENLSNLISNTQEIVMKFL